MLQPTSILTLRSRECPSRLFPALGDQSLPSGDGFKRVYGTLCVYGLLFTSLIPPVSRYFQCGVSNFLLERYDLALLNFEDAYLYLRGNEAMSVLHQLVLS